MARNSRRCSECCKIATDDFNRADADSLGASWSEESGDADIASNELLFATGGSVVIHQTDHPGGADAPRRVKVRFKMPAGGGILVLYPAWTDTNNRIEAIVQTNATCATISLVKYEAGVQTYLNPDGTANSAQIAGDGVPDDEWHTFEVCLEPSNYPYTGDILRAKLTLASGKVYGTQFTGDLAGALNVGMQGSVDIRVDDFYFGWMKDEDTACKSQCPDCRTPCLIESDSFPGGSETTCKWGSGTGIMRVFHPELGTKHYATATADLQSGETMEVRVNMKADGSEYHWAKLALSGTTLTLTVGKTGSTLATETGTSAAGGHTLAACWDGNFVTGSGGGLTDVASSTEVTDGIYAGRSGSADFTSFEFQKHFSADDPDCPDCPEPTVDCDCCEPDPPRVLTADLGGGGWTDDVCDRCDLVQGEYGLITSSGSACDWSYNECCCMCGTQVAASIVRNNGTCKWRVIVSHRWVDPTDDCPFNVIATTATYDSADFEADADCSVVNVTLTKVSEVAGTACNGSLPNTITLYGAAA